MNWLYEMRKMRSDLAVVTERFGLDVVVKADRTGWSIAFEDDTRGVYCPAEVRVTTAGSATEPSAWSNATLYMDHHVRREVGSNKWIAYIPCWSTMMTLDQGREASIQTILSCMEQLGIVPDGSMPVDGVTVDETFVNAFAQIEEALAVSGIAEVNCVREADVESYDFVDGSDVPHRIAFVDDKVRVTGGGEVVGEVSISNLDALAELLRTHLRSTTPRQSADRNQYRR